MKKIHIKIKRQMADDSLPYWDEFEIPLKPEMTVVSALRAIEKLPVTVQGIAVAPVAWECGCLQAQCGGCSMVINGRARLACQTLLSELSEPVHLEPLSKFAVVRDLVVDRSRLYEPLDRAKLWREVDALERPSPHLSEGRAIDALSRQLAGCIYCGACVEACPQFSDTSHFVGALTLGQLYRMSQTPWGLVVTERYFCVLGPDGVVGCANVQNCVKNCPKQIPLDEAVALVKRQTRSAFKKAVFG